MFPATTTLSAHRLRERSLRTKISRVEPPEPRENIESSTSNTERRNERGFALPFDVRRWMFYVGCSSGFIRGQTGRSLPRFRCDLRSEEHTSESSHSQISYAVFCLKKKKGNESAVTISLFFTSSLQYHTPIYHSLRPACVNSVTSLNPCPRLHSHPSPRHSAPRQSRR